MKLLSIVKHGSAAVGACLFSAALLASTASAQQVVRAAHAYQPDTSVYVFWDELAKRVNEKADGKLKIQVFPSGQLGGDEQVFRGLKLGTIQMGSGAAANEGAVTDAYYWMDLPYVFASAEGAQKVFADEQIDKYLRDKLRRDAGTVLLGHISVGGYRLLINNKRALRTPDDVQGLKFRALSNPIDIALLESWGFTATPLPWSDTYTSLEQGMIDGLNLQAQAIQGFGFHELVKHATETRTLMTFHVAQMSVKAFDKLDPDMQRLIMEEAAAALEVANSFDRDDASRVYENLSKHMEIYTPTDEEMKQWEEPAKALWPQFTDKIDAQLLERIQHVQGG